MSLVEGGQGRTVAEITGDGSTFGFIILAAVILILAALLV
jgi:hypothetical protein